MCDSSSFKIIAALKQWPQLDTSSWHCTCGLTLAFDQVVWSHGSRFQLDELQAKRNFHHFTNLLNRRCYGSHAGHRHGVRLRIIPILECDALGRLHYHAAIEPPQHMVPAEFEKVVRQCWSKTRWGNCRFDAVEFRFGADRGWVTYMLKPRQKSGLDNWFDCIDWDSFNNPITGA
jgi:hypothetical protein